MGERSAESASEMLATKMVLRLLASERTFELEFHGDMAILRSAHRARMSPTRSTQSDCIGLRFDSGGPAVMESDITNSLDR